MFDSLKHESQGTISRLLYPIRLSIFGLGFLFCLRIIILQFRYADVLLFVVGASLLLGVVILAWNRILWALFLFIACVPLISGIQELQLIRLGPVLQFTFAGIYVSWFSKRVFFERKKIATVSAPGQLVDFLALTVLVSIISCLVQYPLSEIGSKIGAANMQGQIDRFYFLDAGVIFLQGLFLFRVIEIELKGLDRSKLSFSVFYVHVLLIVIFVAIQLVTSPKSRISIQGFHVNLPFGDIHSFGSYVVFLLFFFAALSVYRKSLLARLFVLVLLILTIASYSRTTWLAMLLVSCFMFLPYWRRPLFYLSTILFLLLVVNVAHYMLPESNSAYLSRFRSLVAIPDYLNAPEMKHRLIFWRAAASMVAEKPLLGSGVGTFYRLSKDYIAKEDLKGIPEVYPEDHPNENAHNFFLQFAAELGVVALILLIGILYLTVRKWISINKLPTTVNVGNLLYLDSSIECRGLCLGILAYLMTQVTGHALILPSHQFLFWYGIALLSRVTPLTNSGSVRASLPEHESFEGVRL